MAQWRDGARRLGGARTRATGRGRGAGDAADDAVSARGRARRGDRAREGRCEAQAGEHEYEYEYEQDRRRRSARCADDDAQGHRRQAGRRARGTRVSHRRGSRHAVAAPLRRRARRARARRRREDAPREGERATFVALVRERADGVRAAGRRWARGRGSAAAISTSTGDRTVVPLVQRMGGHRASRMPPGSECRCSAVRVKARNGQARVREPGHPGRSRVPGGENMTRELPAILPRYPEVSGVPAGRLRTACAAACERVAAPRRRRRARDRRARGRPCPPLASTTLGAPAARAAAADLPRDELVAMTRGASRWHRRLAFGELFALGVAVALRRRERRADAAVPCARIARLAGGHLARAAVLADARAAPRVRRARRRSRCAASR